MLFIILFYLPWCFFWYLWWFFFHLHGLVYDKNIIGFYWDLLVNSLSFMLYLRNTFRFLLFWLFRMRAFLFHFFWPAPRSWCSVSFDFSLYFLAFLPSSLAWVWISQIEITVEFISSRTAGLVFGLVLIFIFAFQITSKINIISFPELIFVNFPLHQIFHFGSSLGPKVHGLEGRLYRRTFLRLLIWVLSIG